MTKAAGFLGFLKQNTATGTPTGTYDTVQQLLTISEVGAERSQIDVSAHGDTWEDIIPGRFAGDDVELTLAWDPTLTTHQRMKTDFDTASPSVRYYEEQHPTWSTAYRYPAYVVHWGTESTDDGAMEGHITLKIVNPGITSVTPS